LGKRPAVLYVRLHNTVCFSVSLVGMNEL